MKINSVRNYCLLVMLAVFGSAHATPGTDIKTATADVVFSSAVKLDHELHTTADAFRLSDLGNRAGSNGQFNYNVLLAQGKISVASGTWNSADQIVVRFSGCNNGNGSNNTICRVYNSNVEVYGPTSPFMMLKLQDSNSNDLTAVTNAGWMILPEHLGVSYYRVINQMSNSIFPLSDMVGTYPFNVEAAVFEN